MIKTFLLVLWMHIALAGSAVAQDVQQQYAELELQRKAVDDALLAAKNRLVLIKTLKAHYRALERIARLPKADGFAAKLAAYENFDLLVERNECAPVTCTEMRIVLYGYLRDQENPVEPSVLQHRLLAKAPLGFSAMVQEAITVLGEEHQDLAKRLAVLQQESVALAKRTKKFKQENGL